jgi:Na+/melibiose symporter-like transporter
MDVKLEQDPTELINCSLFARTKANAIGVWRGSKLPELYRSILYFIIMGSTIPYFGTFLYYYQIKITGLTQITYSWLQVLSYLTLFASTFIYNALLKNWETRNMMYTALIINMIGSATTVLYTTGHFFGLPPVAFLCLTSTVTDTLYNAYTTLPGMVLFAKLIPESVESSMFAMLTGLTNFSNLFMSNEVGIFINKFFGVYYDSETDNNLNEVWKLYCC